MYNLSTEFKKFYYTEVVLSKEETTNLRNKKKINIERLKNGLKEYNEENNTSYAIAETLEQGSVAMSTVTQNDENDYDIDVAIIFDDTNLNGLGVRAVKTMVVEALKKKCTNFKTEPEALTNCVRIVYADNYHIDFAIYKRIKQDDDSYKYEHAGSEWRERNPRSINNWFNDEIKQYGEKLRQAIRLCKMFCKSRSDWKMPGGLIQSVLCDEKIQEYDRMDEMLYYTLKEVFNRLKDSIEVNNPTNGMSLLLKQTDRDKMNNFKNRLNTYLSKLNILFDEDNCTKKDAMDAWYEFFNHNYWEYDEEIEETGQSLSKSPFVLLNTGYLEYDDTEEYIDNIMPVENKYKIKLDCKVTNSRGVMKKLSTFNSQGQKLQTGMKLEFYLDEDRVPKPYKVYWKIKNNGVEAIKNNMIRGQIFENEDDDLVQRKEETSFSGEHYVECYIVKNNVCVAKDKITVNIQ